MKKINGKWKKQEWHDALMDEIDAEIPRVSPTYYNEEEEDLYWVSWGVSRVLKSGALGLLLLCHYYNNMVCNSNIIWTAKIIFRSVLMWHATMNAIILIQWLINTKLLNFINTQTFKGNRFKNTSDNCEELRIIMIFNDFQWFCHMCHATMKGEMLQWTKKYESLKHNLNTEKNLKGIA